MTKKKVHILQLLFLSQTERGSYAMNDNIGIGNAEYNAQLSERAKELKCLYMVDEILQNKTLTLPAAMERTCGQNPDGFYSALRLPRQDYPEQRRLLRRRFSPD
jgi:hypothetical protein